jgi:hypothetical protein
MQVDITLVISAAAILTMMYCLFLVLSLKKNIPGGIVGSKWNLLMSLVGLFTVGYLATPFFSMLPEQVLRLLVSFIFFFGAVYVAVTVKLIYQVIQELSE